MPGTIWVSAVKFRKLAGSESVSLLVKVPPVWLLVTSTSGVSAVTVTTSSMVASSIPKLIVSCAPELTISPV